MHPTHAQAVEITAIPFETAAAALLRFLRDMDAPRGLKLLTCSRMLLDNMDSRESLAALASVVFVDLSERKEDEGRPAGHGADGRPA
jgi:hypothetical protein